MNRWSARVQRSAFSIYRFLVRWAFARFYREFAWTYDTVAALVSGGHWPAWAQTALPYLEGRVLELGCGTGNLQRALARRAPRPAPIGLDASPQMLALARRKVERAGLEARLVRADARALPFPSATFDSLVATFPSDYIVARATLAEARRVLRPSGRLVIVLGARLAGGGLYQRLVDLAYRLTLQHPPRAAEAPSVLAGEGMDGSPAGRLGRELAQARFAVQDRWIAAPGGLVYLIVARASV
jgi:SAM-dependent methyltransferase